MKKPLLKSITNAQGFASKSEQMAYKIVEKYGKDAREILTKSCLLTDDPERNYLLWRGLEDMSLFYMGYRINSTPESQINKTYVSMRKACGKARANQLVRYTEKMVDGIIEEVLGQDNSRSADDGWSLAE